MCPGEQDELSSPRDIQTASLPAKRKEPPTSDSVISKRLKSKAKRKEQLLDINISKLLRRMEREGSASHRLDSPINPVRMKTRKTMDWKLGYLTLWWMRMARESKTEHEEKSMRNISTYFQRNKIKNVSREHTMNYPVGNLRTPPVERDGDTIKGHPPPQQSTHNTSLTVKLTPGKGLKQILDGEQKSSPAKLYRVGPYMNNDASQHTEPFNRLLDTTPGKVSLSDHMHSEKIDLIMDSGLASSAANLRSEAVDLSLEERGFVTVDHYYLFEKDRHWFSYKSTV
jgi:hypothetical protein